MPLRSALKGIRIIDLTSNLPGPLATQILGDFGADVIKIESLKGDNIRHYPPFIGSESMLNLLLNRNKRSLALNLKDIDGLSIFYKLVKTCDILIEGFRPGTTSRLKIDFESLKKIHPSIIYCSLTGYGPKDFRSGHDLNYVGSSGIIHITGPHELPIVPGVPIGDIGGGSLPMVISVLAALLQRKKEAQYISVSITEQLIPWLTVAASNYLAGLGETSREDHILSGYNPFYRLFRTKDKEDRFITFAPLEGKFWKNFCRGIGRKDLISKQFDFEVLNNELPKIFNQKTQSEWEKWFIENDVPGAAVKSLKEALKERHRLKELNHPTLGNINIISSPFLDINAPVTIPPLLGEQSIEILKEIGYTDDNIRKFKENGVILIPNLL